MSLETNRSGQLLAMSAGCCSHVRLPTVPVFPTILAPHPRVLANVSPRRRVSRLS